MSCTKKLLFMILALALPALASCAPPATPTALPALPETVETEGAVEPVESEPTTLRIGDTYIWDTANPAIAWYGYNYRYLIYDTLIALETMDSYGPGLAEDWAVSDDGLVWTFKIREGVTFHDGTPCTAEDVAWSFNWIKETGLENMSSFLISNARDIVALDDTTLQITVAEPVSNIEYLLMYIWILPRSVWEGMTYDDVQEFDDISAGIGTGPYKLAEWVEGEYMILEANEDYWGGPLAIQRIIIREYATEDAMVQALLAGEVDAIENVPYTAVTVLQERENVEVAILEALTVDELSINTYEDGTQPESLNDPAVRLAIEYAIDRQAIIDVAYLGYGEPATTMVPPALGDWHNSDIEAIPFDPAEGNRILDEAGYLDTDGDGIREYRDGTPLAYRLMATQGATAARMLEIISDGLAQIGISAPPVLMDGDSLYAMLAPAYDYDMIYWSWFMDPDPAFAMLLFTCDQREAWAWNDSGYCNPEFDELYRQQAVTLDHEERRQLIWQMQEMIYEARPYIVLTYGPYIQAYRSDRFTGFGLESGDIFWRAAFLQARPVQ